MHLCPGLLLPAVAKEQSEVKALHGQLTAQRLPDLTGSLKIVLLKAFKSIFTFSFLCVVGRDCSCFSEEKSEAC